MDFLLKYYIYFVGVLVLFVLGVIGYLVDSYKTDKYRKPKIKKEIKRDVPKVGEASNDFIENLNLDEIGNKTISGLQKEKQEVSSVNTPASAEAHEQTLNNTVNAQQQTTINDNQNQNLGV